MITGGDSQIHQAGLLYALYGYLSGGKIDYTALGTVYAADIQHQPAVDQNPKVIVATKLELHIVSVQILVAVGAGLVGEIELTADFPGRK